MTPFFCIDSKELVRRAKEQEAIAIDIHKLILKLSHLKQTATMSLFEAPFPAGPEMKSSFLRCGVWIATFEMAVLDEFDKRIEWFQLDEKKNSSIIH